MSEALARGLIRLIVTVGILAAVYFLLLRPILDTTNKAFDSIGGVESSIDNAFDDAGINPPDISGVGRTDAEKVLACVERVQPNASKMQRCAARLTR